MKGKSFIVMAALFLCGALNYYFERRFCSLRDIQILSLFINSIPIS